MAKIKQNPTGLLITDDQPGLTRQDAAFRVFDKDKQQVFYASTRMGTVVKTETGYLVEVPDEFNGLKYELKKIGMLDKKQKVLTGTIEIIPDKKN